MRRLNDLDDISATGIDQETLSKTLNQLFSKALQGRGRANMLMGSGAGAVSGSVSGNLVKASMLDKIRQS